MHPSQNCFTHAEVGIQQEDINASNPLSCYPAATVTGKAILQSSVAPETFNQSLCSWNAGSNRPTNAQQSLE